MVAASLFAGFFERDRILGILHNAHCSGVAIGSAANLADRFSRKVKALRAIAHLLLRLHQRGRQRLDFGLRTLENMKSQPLGRFRPNTRQTLQLLDQASQGRSINGSVSIKILPF